jgi:phosphate transport system substrate-binding protein
MKRMNFWRGFAYPGILSVCLVLLSLVGCSEERARLTITGSSTMAPLITDMAELFEKQAGVRVDVQSGGSGRGINDTLTGLAQIGMSSRALTSDEVESGLVAHTIAWDGIAVIVHKDNPLAELDREQIRSIYRGEARNWHELGGANQAITVINKAEGRSTLTLFLEYFDMEGAEVKANLVAGENQQVILSVAGNPGAIGYVSIGAAEVAANQGESIRLLPLAGVPASVAAVRTGEYPLRRELNLVTLGTPSPTAATFLEMMQMAALHAVITAHHFVPASR